MRDEIKTMEGWSQFVSDTDCHDFSEYVDVGDAVSLDILSYFSNAMPPASLNDTTLQVGSHHNYQYDDTNQKRPTFATFVKDEDVWRFCGYCFRGETREPWSMAVNAPTVWHTPEQFDYLTSYGETERVELRVGVYRYDDNLHIGMDYFDPELGGIDRFADITVNVCPLPDMHAAIDTNNNGEKIVDFLIENDFGKPTGQYVRSGYCAYPVFAFDEQKLAKIDPNGLGQYQRVRHIESGLPSLDEAIGEASESAAKKNDKRRQHHHVNRSKVNEEIERS